MDICVGAQDIGNFRQTFSAGLLPSETSITHEGLLNEHFFDVGTEEVELFSCKWSFAASPDPFSGEMEYYVGCGTRGRLSGDGIKKHGRPHLNLVIVLDISGSMCQQFGERASSPNESKSLLDVAKDCILTLTSHLTPEDALGFVIFDCVAEVVQKLESMKTLDSNRLKKALFDLSPRGGTDMENGLSMGVSLFNGLPDDGKQKRIMFLTDAQPNHGATSPHSLFGICKVNAEEHQIFTSFFGLGVNFGVDLVDTISHIPACNYFTVNSPKEFKKLMDCDFDYIVTPSCFDVEVKIASESSVVPERVYGSPGHEIPEAGVLMRMISTFPSPKEESGLTKGSFVLIKVKPKEGRCVGQLLKVKVSYKDAQGKPYYYNADITLGFGGASEQGKVYSDESIRKAILLVRYVNLMKWWIRDTTNGNEHASVSLTAGLPAFPVSKAAPSSFASVVEKSISPHYQAIFQHFLNHYEDELDALISTSGDETQEDQQLKNHTEEIIGLINHA